MEQELQAALNYPSEPFYPWAADEELHWLIITGQLVPPVDA